MLDQPEIAEPIESSRLTGRQKEVLGVVLDLMVREGNRFSMAAVARQASCSKETLYRWFGDRDGLLTATVQHQAARVALPEFERGQLDLVTFERLLKQFAINWLQVITGDVSAALNRLAIADASSGQGQLGEIVLQNGPIAISHRLRPLFELARTRKLIGFENTDVVFRTYFGLVVGDWQIRKLLGDRTRPSDKGIEVMAERAVQQFMAIYRAGGEAKSIHT